MDARREDLPAGESLELLRSQRVGRLSIIDDGVPLALPVSYCLTNGVHELPQVVVRCAPESLIGRYNGPTSLEVDVIDLDLGRAWSVIARGELRHLHGDHPAVDPQPFVSRDRHSWVTDAPWFVAPRAEDIGHCAAGGGVR